MNESDSSLLAAWKKSRHGAWAGGGFHYQHLISTLILVRQWAGLAPAGYLVPEGLDDCVVELPQQRIWLQVKSRNKGVFSEAEVETIFTSINSKAAMLNRDAPTSSVVVLNQECSGVAAENFEKLFDDVPRKVILCNSPEEEIVNLLTKVLDTAEIIAEGIASDLYKLIADTSFENASVSYSERRRISTSEIERRIFERLEAEDPSAIDQALASGALEPIDFRMPVNERSFYLGVKAKPGHVAAGLVLPRPDNAREVTCRLKDHRHVLIAGPSGAGKSALMWLSASSLASEFRWFQIAAKATANDADSIIRFVRARRPSPISPIGLAFDEVSSANSDLWDVLLRELRGLPEVYVLGSVRTEDIYLIANQSDTQFIQVSLDEKLAESVWMKLKYDGHTTWSHWREPLEQSEGLMLEYVHILTQGSRLAAVIGEQVRQREHENRTDELSIIRCTAELCRHGGEVEVGRLFKLLDMPAERSSLALKRLIDEHLVHESRPGVLGGLHSLRSKALSDASHDELAYLRTDSLWRGFLSTTAESLPRIVQSVLNESEGQGDESMLRKLAELLASSDDIERWTAILTGLGLATLERYVVSFISILEGLGVQRAHWSLASMFFDPSTNVPDMPELEQWQALKGAVEAFRTTPKSDLRSICLEFLPKGTTAPACNSLQKANLLLSSAVAIADGPSVPINIIPEFSGENEQSIEEVAALLSTAFLVDPNIAESLVNSFGGEEVLSDWFLKQTPWVTRPTIEPDGSHGRTVRANWYLVAVEYQSDPHETIIDICKKLIAIFPTSDAVASDVIDPQGRLIKTGDHALVSKNIPRDNLPSNSRVAWNVAFRHILLARAAGDSLTKYTQHMSQLIPETEKLFRSYTEKWISGKKIGNANALAAGINKINQEVNSLTYTEPRLVSTSMTTVAKDATADETIGALLTGVLGNLIPRMNKLASDGSTKGAASFAGSLAAQARDHQQSKIWRTTSAPPLKKLSALANRLDDVSSVLHEMAHDDSPSVIQGIMNVAKRASLSKSVHLAAQRCRMQADQRLQKKLHAFEKKLAARCCHAKCWTRPIEEPDSVYWPPVEIAILVDIADFETDSSCLEECLSVAKKMFGQKWQFRVVPVIEDRVLPAFAMLFLNNMVLPDQDFAKEWMGHIDQQFHSSDVSDAFDKAMSACMHLSGIVHCRNLEKMNTEEEEVTENIIDDFKSCRKHLQEAARATGLEELEWALEKVDITWNQLVEESEARKNSKVVSSPLFENIYAALSEDENDWVNELAATRLLLQQAEIRTGIVDPKES
ncbi:MAG TPA: hypothetical protein ENK04_15605 [Gammaproteobacteria bacterium]|nr:hypothetical protein [Gammaproteobacteria bacterium]